MRNELAGSLRERIMLETRIGGRDALAGATGEYAYSGDCWASLIPISSGPQEEGASHSAMPRWKVTIRKREGIDLRTRLTWRSKYLAVRSIINDPREAGYMTLTCEEAR